MALGATCCFIFGATCCFMRVRLTLGRDELQRLYQDGRCANNLNQQVNEVQSPQTQPLPKPGEQHMSNLDLGYLGNTRV